MTAKEKNTQNLSRSGDVNTVLNHGANGQAMLESILNGMEALVCVCDSETLEILFLNNSIQAHFGTPNGGAGQKCYKFLQGLDHPCPTCPHDQLWDAPNHTLVWEHHEVVKGSVLRKTAQLIDWPNGKKAHLEYAIDITETRYREKMLDVVNRMAQILLSQNEKPFSETATVGVGLIAGILKSIDRLSMFRNIEKPDGLYASQIYRWKKNVGCVDPKPELRSRSYDRRAPRWKDILSSGECINDLVRNLPEVGDLELGGCMAALAIPMFSNGRFWGFVLVENLTEERTFTPDEVAILRSASFMLINTAIRSEETKKIRMADAQLKKMMGELEYQNSLLHTVNRVSAVLLQSNADTFESDLLRSMSIMGKAAKADRVYIWKNRTEGGERYCDQIYEWSGGAEPQQGKEQLRNVSYSNTMPSWEEAFLQGKCVNGIVRKFPARERDTLMTQGILSVLIMPIYLREHFWGFVGFDDCHTERVFSENEEKVLRSASELITNALTRSSMEANILHLETEVEQIHYDPLTGIYNRRFFDKSMRQLIPSLSRSSGELSLLMVDIDYFKKYNDTYGHSEGDTCLKIISKTLQNSISRTEDFVARFGGEEFVVVLPNTDESGANIVAKRILSNIRQCGIPHEKSSVASCVTVSVGVTTGRVKHTHSSDDYVRRADEMLYQAKGGGRNRSAFARLQDRLPYAFEGKKYTSRLSSALAAITKLPVLSSGVLEDAAWVITEMGCHALDTHRVGVWLIHPGGDFLKSVASYDIAAEEHSLQDDFDLSGRARYIELLRFERVVVIHDINQPDNPLPNIAETYGPDICALLDAPIRVSGELVGVVCIEQDRCDQYPEKREWTIEEQNFVSSLADLMALAITNAKRKPIARSA